jgi:hypothetical protein
MASLANEARFQRFCAERHEVLTVAQAAAKWRN